MKDVNITNRMLSLMIGAGVIHCYKGSDHCRKNKYLRISSTISLPAYCLNDKGRVIKMRVHIIEYKPSEL